MIPGEILFGEGTVELNARRPVIRLVVRNLADRPIQVGSHYHFAEANAGLEFDRAAAWGRRTDVPAGTSVRFEPGIETEVALVPLVGARVVPGLRKMVGGSLDQRPPTTTAPPSLDHRPLTTTDPDV